MRKINIVNVVVPELVACFSYNGKNLSHYQCTNCGAGVLKDYVCCPMCGADLDWKRWHETEETKAFREFIESL